MRTQRTGFWPLEIRGRQNRKGTASRAFWKVKPKRYYCCVGARGSGGTFAAMFLGVDI
jgi:hypothetical protein